jgi:hypothetical protein
MPPEKIIVRPQTVKKKEIPAKSKGEKYVI